MASPVRLPVHDLVFLFLRESTVHFSASLTTGQKDVDGPFSRYDHSSKGGGGDSLIFFILVHPSSQAIKLFWKNTSRSK
ncbi:hypothetical protein Bpfe_018264 [Biomphalaria pfeifferi]|uniref:Uncharacterized protein n=1 Tax=Biomphalaria pfeifferi TaxID=112525 RepID=A0AAD8BCZ8_BIOPF|nr:hypothetical protein Bpfe_018264 [Biomphalaria pfeifferi]